MSVAVRRPARPVELAAVALTSLIVVGLAVRFYRLGAQSLWLDELWTAAATDPGEPLGEWLGEWILPDVHPPLYYLLIRLWRPFAGADEWALRFPSAVFSALIVGAVPLVHLWTPVVRRPLSLTALLATSTGAIVYAQEARSYTLLILLAALVTCLGVGIARRMGEGKPVGRALAALAVAVLALEYIHYFGVLVAAGVFAALMLSALKQRDQKAARVVLMAGIAALALFLPWMAIHLPHLRDKLGGAFWITNDWSRIATRFATFAAGDPALFTALCVLITGTLVIRPRRAGRPEYLVPLAIVIVVIGAAMAISLHSPVVTDRNLFVLLPPFYVLTAAAFGDLEGVLGGTYRSAIRLLPALLAAANLGFAAQWIATHRRDQWRQAAAFVRTLPGCEDGLLPVNAFPKEIYGYYLPQSYRTRLVEVSTERPGPLPLTPAEFTRRACPLLLWSGNMVGEGVVIAWIERLDLNRDDVLVKSFQGHTIILDRRDPAVRDGQ